MKTSARAKLVGEVFSTCLDARREFNVALERCAIKGWPERVQAARTAAKVQELFFSQLAARLTHLTLENPSDDTEWSTYTSTAQVQERLQGRWGEQEELALRLRDKTYAQIESEIATLQAIADPEALDEPYRMAKRDPELIAAGWKLNNTVWELDRALALPQGGQ